MAHSKVLPCSLKSFLFLAVGTKLIYVIYIIDECSINFKYTA